MLMAALRKSGKQGLHHCYVALLAERTFGCSCNHKKSNVPLRCADRMLSWACACSGLRGPGEQPLLWPGQFLELRYACMLHTSVRWEGIGSGQWLRRQCVHYRWTVTACDRQLTAAYKGEPEHRSFMCE